MKTLVERPHRVQTMETWCRTARAYHDHAAPNLEATVVQSCNGPPKESSWGCAGKSVRVFIDIGTLDTRARPSMRRAAPTRNPAKVTLYVLVPSEPVVADAHDRYCHVAPVSRWEFSDQTGHEQSFGHHIARPTSWPWSRLHTSGHRGRMATRQTVFIGCPVPHECVASRQSRLVGHWAEPTHTAQLREISIFSPGGAFARGTERTQPELSTRSPRFHGVAWRRFSASRLPLSVGSFANALRKSATASARRPNAS
jgi:hypothetical protein